MKKKRLEGMILALAVAVSTIFAPMNVAAADSVESKSVTLQDSAKDENGKDELYTLKEAGVGAICLQRAATDFSLNSQKDNTQNGQIRSTGIFLYENGNAGTMQQLDLAQ